MLVYSEADIKTMIYELLGSNNFDITPIGNHHLQRHLVYRIDPEKGNSMVFKLYYKSGRRSREVAALRLLENTDIKCSKIIKHGKIGEDDWLLINYIEGELFDKVISGTSKDYRLKLFEEMGEELGKLHSFRTFDFFGEWDEHGNSIDGITQFYDIFVRITEETINSIFEQQLPEADIFKKAAEDVRASYKLFDIEVQSRLRHNDFDGRNILVSLTQGEPFISGIIDFEQSCPGNCETDFVGLYYRYFLDNRDYEAAFKAGYGKYMNIDEGFYGRLRPYLLKFALGNCSWAYYQARDYYWNNVKLIQRLLSSESSLPYSSGNLL